MRARSQPPPPERIAEHLIELRRRGVTFDRAWTAAWRSIRWSHSNDRTWQPVLRETREYWRKCYERQPVAMSFREMF